VAKARKLLCGENAMEVTKPTFSFCAGKLEYTVALGKWASLKAFGASLEHIASSSDE